MPFSVEKIHLMVITAFIWTVGNMHFMLHFPMEKNICKCFGLYMFLLYEGRVHRNNTTINNQLINVFNSTARPGCASTFLRQRGLSWAHRLLSHSSLMAWARLEAGVESFAALY